MSPATDESRCYSADLSISVRETTARAATRQGSCAAKIDTADKSGNQTSTHTQMCRGVP
eukprot:CAMPEP_0204111278 /NCGR_PEP_ID=MMETSP0361-20130328/2361_1 /ASSEMBLY_ACC=CAM_ASM_000343 /TAXON_ID=268821 /ORGANISM="Scrippsiella Hangoei, Strain SHTV-5" /LENGTH=58 /DNA_ID=CAMNT_0051061291 /DNA_START=190 /DNA_END=363 /DNA_ORIENTATION=-